MNNKILIALIIMASLSFGMGAGTHAWLTSQAASSGNIFQTGELILGFNDNTVADGFINANNLAPGDSTNAFLDIRNEGDFDFKYKVSAAMSNGDINLFNKLKLTINNGTVNLYDGPLNLLDQQIGIISPEGTQRLYFTVTLPTDSGNQYQNTTCIAQIKFNATQVDNQGWTQ